MKLSEMTVDEAFTKIVVLVPHITNILKNDEIKEIVKKVEIKGDTREEKLNNGYAATLEKINPFINLIFKECKEDLFSITAIMIDKTVKEVKKMSIISFIAIAMDIAKDEELIKLFTQRIG